jgi:glycogen synthase
MRYGPVPIVWATGGLDDAVTQYDASDRLETGFKFTEFESAAMLGSL